MRREETIAEGKHFGRYLRRIREERRLSLDSVEEMSACYPDRITKSHLSRIENGRAVPTFPRMFTLSQIYGVPVASLADRFEVALKRSMATETYSGLTWDELKEESNRLRIGGRYLEALSLIDRMLERGQAAEGDEALRVAKLDRIVCLYQLGRFSLAKEECEELLSETLSDPLKVRALQLFIVTSYRLGRYTVAWMALDHAFGLLDSVKGSLPSRVEWDFRLLRGNVFFDIGNYDEARRDYESALAGFREEGLDFEVCRLQINIGSVEIQQQSYDEANRILLDALQRAEAGRYDRQIAFALSGLGLVAFRRGRLESAGSYLIRSNTIARPREYANIVFRNCYYLWKIASARGDEAGVVSHERSLRSHLGRIEDHLPEAVAYRAHLSGAES